MSIIVLILESGFSDIYLKLLYDTCADDQLPSLSGFPDSLILAKREKFLTWLYVSICFSPVVKIYFSLY